MLKYNYIKLVNTQPALLSSVTSSDTKVLVPSLSLSSFTTTLSPIISITSPGPSGGVILWPLSNAVLLIGIGAPLRHSLWLGLLYFATFQRTHFLIQLLRLFQLFIQ